MPTPTPRPTRAVPTRAPRTPTPTPAPVSTPIAALEEMPIYEAGSFVNGFSALSLDTPSPDPAYEGRLYLGAPTLLKNLYLAGNDGEFMSVSAGGELDLDPYTHVRFTANSITAQGSWISVSLAVQPWEAGASSVQVFIPAGDWFTFSIPIEKLDTFKSDFGVRGIGFRGERGPRNNNDNSVAFGEISLVKLPDLAAPEVVSVSDVSANLVSVELSEPSTAFAPRQFVLSSTADPAFATGLQPVSVEPYESGRFLQLRFDRPMQDGVEYSLSVSALIDASGNVSGTTDHSLAANTRFVTLTVDATTDVRPFSSKIRGVTMQTRSWIWADIVGLNSAKRAALLEAASRISPGIIRFAGGPWINSTGWDRADTAPADGDWMFTDPDSGESFDYRHTYKPAMIDSYAAFAAELGAESIIQVNICDGNPAMWADLVSYTNIENSYNFEYWELGDRIDQNECLSVFEYAERFAEYSQAMKAIDPTIKIIGPTPTQPQRFRWLETLATHPLARPDALTFQWYQLLEWTDNRNAFAYEIGSADALLNYNTEAGDGCWIGFGCDTGSIDSEELDRMSFRRGIAEAMADEVLNRLTDSNEDLETAITEFGVHAAQPENPINGNHIAAIWLADMMARWAYHGLDILTYNGLETGTSGVGHTTGILGIEGSQVIDVRPTYYTQWLYANHFGDVLVESGTSDDDRQVVVWASRDSDDPNKLKLMLINLSDDRAVASLNVSGFNPSSGEFYVMASTAPTSNSNPQSFAEHETSINGIVIPDVSISSPLEFSAVVDSIAPIPVNVGPQFEYELQPYSVVALTLSR